MKIKQLKQDILNQQKSIGFPELYYTYIVLSMRGKLRLSSIWQGWLMEDLKRQKNKAPSLHGSRQKCERFTSFFY